MGNRFRWIFAGLLIMFLGLESQLQATHIRAGEITVERLDCSARTFRITITGWVDKESTVEFGGGELAFGDGSPNVNLRSDAQLILDQDLGNNVGVVQFQITHTYGANGTYVLSYLEANRNAGILNMNNSVETTFYIETMIIIDPFLGCNNTPVLLIPPVDDACVGATFFHNPGAFDADGDSVSYELTIPKRDKDQDVSNYRFPNDPEFGGTTEAGAVPPTFDINAGTGDITWDAPGTAGEYNIAFLVNEWRNKEGQWFLLSSITRDMQIIVEDCDNERPELEVPDDVCVTAGDTLNTFVIGTDPDGDPVMIEAFGGPFEVESPATFEPFPPVFEPQPASGNFEWQTNCFHVRDQPYQVTFKITDDPEDGPNLVGFEPWNITVVAPAPEGLNLTLNPDRTSELTWDQYACSNAEFVQVWRRVDSYDFPIEECETGIPEFARYELIAEVDPSQTSFVDDNAGEFLDFGANYCYRLVAVFPSPAGGESYASVEVCGIIKADAPVFTNVTVDETSETDGVITVKWQKPFEIDTTLFPPPYLYDLYRAEGFSEINGAAAAFEQGRSKAVTLIGEDIAENDTVFVDTGLNTEETPYFYRLVLKDINGNEIIVSSTASSVYLSPKSLFQQIELSWDADVPWSNNTQGWPTHFIFRDNVTDDESELALIAVVDVNNNGFLFLDDGSHDGNGLDENTLYCYYVVTRGSYGNPKIASPLINLSQRVCAQPNDTIPPCPPILSIVEDDCEAFLSDKPCGFTDLQNQLFWRRDEDPSCEDETISYYNLYYSSSGEEEDFVLLETELKDTTFIHDNLASFAGCYYVTAVDRSENESDPSNIVCNDNCPNYVLPNVFTPNDDGINDVFNAMNPIDNPDITAAECPRFVNSVKFTVINRYGKVVYTYESGGENDILIGWDGLSNDGQQLASGVYYYTAEVEFEAIDPSLRNQTLRGWVQILR